MTKTATPQAVPSPDVTVVVCTFNRAEGLRTALQSLVDLTMTDRRTYEILVVDNASTDHTADVVEEVTQDSRVPVRYVHESQQGIVPARNRGVAEATGEWIAFFDDDQRADPDWLAQLLATAVSEQVRCVGGAVKLELPDGHRRRLSPVCRMLLGESVEMYAPQDYSATVTPGCGNLMVHHTVFEQIGTFRMEFADRGEDTDLFQRMLSDGICGRYTPQAVVHHIIPAERLSDEFLLVLSQRMSAGMAEDERATRGWLLFPAFWCARLAQATLLLLPRLLWAWLSRDSERLLGARCRLVIAYHHILDGLPLMLPRFSA